MPVTLVSQIDYGQLLTSLTVILGFGLTLWRVAVFTTQIREQLTMVQKATEKFELRLGDVERAIFDQGQHIQRIIGRLESVPAVNHRQRFP